MFSTKSVQALKLFDRYHAPASLSKQQSQKLLDGLKTSFRKQLDREYGCAADEPTAASTAATEDGPHFRHSPVTQHLKSILSNPLFSSRTQVILPAKARSPRAKRDPMDVFDDAVFKGMMNLKAATGCMVAKRRLLSRPNAAEELSSSQTAVRVLRWLQSSGLEADLSFLDDLAFLRVLTPLLIAEGLEETVWNWISRTMSDTRNAWDKRLRVQRAAFLLAQMVQAKSQPQHGTLDTAITTILRAEQLFQNHPLLPQILILPWRSISWLSTVESYSRAAPSEKMFDAHLAIADHLPRRLEMETAHLHLHHPTHPDHMPAMRFFNDKDKVHQLIQKFSPDKNKLNGLMRSFSPDKLDLPKLVNTLGVFTLPWVAFLGHDTVNRLWMSGQKREADSVTELLRLELGSFDGEWWHPRSA
ncbi:hypothetical protein E4U11_004854 [Claviceps purpurea]|nr:hypothetical protein E4U11_004854 [Claviceps purpurea]